MPKEFSFTVSIFLLCALLLAACASGGSTVKEGEDEAVSAEDETADGNDADMWAALTFVSQLYGDWKGSSVIDVPADESKGFPKTGFYADLVLSCSGRNITQRITISFSKFLEDLLATHPSSGLIVDDLWEQYVKRNYAAYTLIEDEYALVIEVSSPVETMFNSRDDRLYINQNETRLRWLIKSGPLNELLEPFGVIDSVECILKNVKRLSLSEYS